MKSFLGVAALFLALAGCSAHMPQRDSVADNSVAVKASGAVSVGVGTFKGVGKFDDFCPGVGPISSPDGMTPEAYVRKALVDELKVAGVFAERDPQVTLTGHLQEIALSSSRAITGGSWDLGLAVASSNNKTTYVTEHYEFNSGVDGMTTCKQTAEAFMPAVRNLIGTLVKSPEFKALVASVAPAVSPAPEPARPVAVQPAVAVAPPAPVLVAPAPVPAVQPAPARVAAVPVPEMRQGKFSWEAERLPEVRACLGGASVTTVAVGPGVELYSARCTNGDVLAVRCEFGNCRVLR